MNRNNIIILYYNNIIAQQQDLLQETNRKKKWKKCTYKVYNIVIIICIFLNIIQIKSLRFDIVQTNAIIYGL